MKTTKAILIDVYNRTITEVNVEGLKGLQNCVGGYIETAHHDGDNDIFVNEEGLFLPNRCWFNYEGGHQPFSGNGIMVGSNYDGDTVDCTMTVEEVTKKVKFLTEAEVRATINID